jgi:fatty acid desaturase
VDRSFGPLLDHTFHHIVDTHVCHHLFSKMPFYHAQEATEAMKKVGIDCVICVVIVVGLLLVVINFERKPAFSIH